MNLNLVHVSVSYIGQWSHRIIVIIGRLQGRNHGVWRSSSPRGLKRKSKKYDLAKLIREVPALCE